MAEMYKKAVPEPEKGKKKAPFGALSVIKITS